MKILSFSPESQTKCCVDSLETAIEAGDTRLIRNYAGILREDGLNLGIVELVKTAEELMHSVSVCSLGASLMCLEALRHIIDRIS